MNPAPVPNRLIFVWLGSGLPWAGRLAIRSAVKHCRPEECLLLHQGLETALPEIGRNLGDIPLKAITIDELFFSSLPSQWSGLWDLYGQLTSPASKSNLVRLTALYQWGGVYLDTDTLTVKDLAPLRHHEGFCGLEHIALPQDLFASLNPMRWTRAGALLAIREACARWPGGYRAFRKVQSWLDLGVNNAVIGAGPGNSRIAGALDAILNMDSAERLKRFRLGTHLLQRVTRNQSSDDMAVLPPEYFYPLGPEISAHWFRPAPLEAVNEMLTPNTYVVHWYQSVEGRFLRQPFDADWVRRHPEAPISRLAEEYVSG